MPEMHLKQPGFTCSACGTFTKNKERIQKSKKTRDTKYIYKNVLDKACFQYVMAYGDFKDLERKAASDSVLRDKAFNIAKNPKYDGYQRGPAFIVYKFFDKKTLGNGVTTLANNGRPLDISTQKLAEELHKLIIEKIKKNQFILDS